MRVVLVHNASAGSNCHDAETLVNRIRRAGHEVRRCLDPAHLERHLDVPADLVAAVGGDGTVKAIAHRLVGREVPLTIIPAGTANNLAHSLGIGDDADALIAGWQDGTLHPLDAGRAVHPWGERVFFESAGLGLVTEAMCLAISHEEAGGRAFAAGERFDRDFRLLRQAARDFPPFECTITMDETRIGAQVILAEFMNTRQIGSRMVLAPAASTGDGLLDLVLVTTGERDLLRSFLDREPSEDHPPHLPARKGRRFTITSPTHRLHLADDIVQLPDSDRPWTLSIEVMPAAVRVLVPG